ncbi:hypothetical protein BDZ89DRAFT_1163331 [Hymenopellis radicata]|nr:hypothetical protein BDZ89DRAFT_1163331 [Hymenopellis radicata]
MTTRIRAIPSTLSAKASPLVPPPSKAFDPAVKAVLRHRLTYNIFLSTLAFAWVQVVALYIWTLGGLQNIGVQGLISMPFNLPVILVAVVGWFTTAVPVLVLRKSCLTAHQSVQTSPLKTLQAALRQSSTRQAFITYLFSAACATALHVFVSRTSEATDPRLNIFVKSKKHPTYLNGRLLFLILSQFSVACVALLRSTMMDRLVFRWPSHPNKPITFGDYMRVMTVVTVLATVSIPLSLPLFPVLRVFLRLPLIRTLLKPFVAHFAKGSYSFILLFRNLALLGRAWVLAWSTLSMWEVAEMIFDSYVSRPISISSPETVVSGVSSSDMVFRYFAYAEITPAKIFTASTSILWPALCRESLITLGQDYQHFLRRGVPPAVPLLTPTALAPQVNIPSTPLKTLHQPIFRAQAQSPVQKVINSLAGNSGAEVPDALKSVIPKPPPTSNLSRYIPQLKVPPWFTQDRPSKIVESLLPTRDLDLLIVDVLSRITVASLTDDKYGVIQRDIPKVLEAMCVFLDEIEAYQRDMPSGDEEERQKAAEILGRMAEGLQEGISRIVRTFGIKLNAFKFPPRVARKLQGFLDYL